MNLDMEQVEFALLVPLVQEKRRYILEWRASSEEDGRVDAFAFVVMKREGGLLLAVRAGVLADEDLEPSELGLVGPSTTLAVSGVLEEEGNIGELVAKEN